MAKKITKIPATLNRFNLEPVVAIRKRRVAGYARVSTDRDEQATSYEAQMAYYKAYIENREDWEFVGMYSDEGISATNTKKRDGFKQMIEDALAGKIDLIITKSVSRFARNTVDSLSTIRKLKEKGVEVYLLTPGPTKTKFKGMDRKLSKFEKIYVTTPEEVAIELWKGIERKKKIIIPGKINKILYFIDKFIQLEVKLKSIKKIQEKKIKK